MQLENPGASLEENTFNPVTFISKQRHLRNSVYFLYFKNHLFPLITGLMWPGPVFYPSCSPQWPRETFTKSMHQGRKLPSQCCVSERNDTVHTIGQGERGVQVNRSLSPGQPVLLHSSLSVNMDQMFSDLVWPRFGIQEKSLPFVCICC